MEQAKPHTFVNPWSKSVNEVLSMCLEAVSIALWASLVSSIKAPVSSKFVALSIFFIVFFKVRSFFTICSRAGFRACSIFSRACLISRFFSLIKSRFDVSSLALSFTHWVLCSRRCIFAKQPWPLAFVPWQILSVTWFFPLCPASDDLG